MPIRATEHFHRGLPFSRLNKRKRISEKHTEIFLEFLVFLKESKLKKGNKNEKNIYTRKLPIGKRRTWKSFWFFFLVLQQFKLGRKIKKKKETYFCIFFKVFRTHKKKERKII